MLRITRRGGVAGAITLELAGSITELEVPELREAVRDCWTEGRGVSFDLAEVRFADVPGALALLGFELDGVGLTRHRGFLRRLLEEVAR